MKKNNACISFLSDPEIVEVNRLDPYSDHLYYDSILKANNGSEMDWKQSLNGEWFFAYAKNPNERIKDFYKDDFNCNHFDRIKVPSHIQMQGYDQIHYINTLYPWDGKEYLRPPHISEKYNPTGSYVKYFELNDTLKNIGDIDIVFEGVECAYYVWLNGKFIGYSEDSFTNSTFNLNDALKDGINKLAVEVYKYSSASWLEDQDFFRFSGIFRDVSLFARPKHHIKDLFITSKLKDNYCNADISVKLKGDLQDVKLKVEIFDGDNTIYKCDVLKNDEISFSLSDVKLWSAEKPNRYKMMIIVTDQSDNIIEVIPQFFGIREFKIEDKIMKLNGQRIVFKGINRHEFSSKKGRAISKEEMLFDIKFMKQHNINAVRTSHYPNNSLWYDLCDEYGIYLIDEANLESHGSWQKLGECEPSWNVPGCDNSWRISVIDRAANMLQRDKNHPSILIYSCGNESYAGENISAMANYFRENDNTRLVHYEGCVWNREFSDSTDMESRMYNNVEKIKKYLDNDPDKPYISCEYMHAMGNSLGGMSHYTDLESIYPMYQGGFIWDYIDQAVEYKNQYGEKVLGYGGDFKDRYTDYNFSGNGIVFADRTISPKACEVKYNYQDIKIMVNDQGFIVDNQMLFTDCSDFIFEFVAKCEEEVIQQGFIDVTLAPLQKKQFSLEWSKSQNEVVYTVSALLKEDTKWQKKGYEVAFGQMIKEKSFNETIKNEKLNIVEGDGNIGVYSEGFKALFSSNEGLISLVYDDVEYMAYAPKPIFSRASTDNDRGCKLEHRTAIWHSASTFFNCTSFTYKIENNSVSINYTFTLPTVPQTTFDINYELSNSKDIKVNFKYHGISNLPELVLVGMRFKLYSEFEKFKYYGRGPFENYLDRKVGSKIGVYTQSIKDNVTPYLCPQECGNRSDVRYVKVINEFEKGIEFVALDKPFEMSVLPYSMQQFENALHQEELQNPYYTYVNIIAKQMGVGGDDSWGSEVLDEYKIASDKDIELSFIIKSVK
ncbi:MAG: glycoside hydrolase family 2 TIM barrel-domain containing protein [Anaerorhabdus sp.]